MQSAAADIEEGERACEFVLDKIIADEVTHDFWALLNNGLRHRG